VEVSSELVDSLFDVGILCCRILSVFGLGAEVFDSISDIEVCSGGIDGIIDNLVVSVSVTT
jgi:hypothetical protein